jgi:hypothetical protein
MSLEFKEFLIEEIVVIIKLGGKETMNALNLLHPMLPRISYSLPSTCFPYPPEDIFVPSSQIL